MIIGVGVNSQTLGTYKRGSYNLGRAHALPKLSAH